MDFSLRRLIETPQEPDDFGPLMGNHPAEVPWIVLLGIDQTELWRGKRWPNGVFNGDLMVVNGDFMVILWWFYGDLMVINMGISMVNGD